MAEVLQAGGGRLEEELYEIMNTNMAGRKDTNRMGKVNNSDSTKKGD